MYIAVFKFEGEKCVLQERPENHLLIFLYVNITGTDIRRDFLLRGNCLNSGSKIINIELIMRHGCQQYTS
jgi:hypothetical protein